MKYPVMNLRPRMGGMLEDYQNDINRLKAALNAQRSAFSGYTPPPSQYPPAPPLPPPAPPEGGGATYFPPRQPGMVATGRPKPPNPNDITVVKPPAPPPVPTGGGLNPYGLRPGVVTGLPESEPTFRPDFGYPPVPEKPTQECPPGYTWTPSGCLQNVPSIDRTQVTQAPTVPTPTSSAMVPTIQTPATSGMVPGLSVNIQPSSERGPGATAGDGASVASMDCGPGRFWDGTQCRGSVGSLPSIPGGAMGPSGISNNINFNPGEAGASGGMLLGRVRLMGSSSNSMRPRQVVIVGILR